LAVVVQSARHGSGSRRLKAELQPRYCAAHKRSERSFHADVERDAGQPIVGLGAKFSGRSHSSKDPGQGHEPIPPRQSFQPSVTCLACRERAKQQRRGGLCVRAPSAKADRPRKQACVAALARVRPLGPCVGTLDVKPDEGVRPVHRRCAVDCGADSPAELASEGRSSERLGMEVILPPTQNQALREFSGLETRSPAAFSGDVRHRGKLTGENAVSLR
jgi:hypothetical protein